MKKFKEKFFHLLLMMLAVVTTAWSGVLMAEAADLPDAGKTQEGAATQTAGRENGDPEFYQKDIDKRIVRIRPTATPVDQISRYAKAEKSESFIVKYYSVGTRPIKCKTNAQMDAMTQGLTTKLLVDDPEMFTKDDTIRVVGVKAITAYNGTAYEAHDPHTPDLVLHVVGRDTSDSMPTVYAVNGKKDTNGRPIYTPLIPSGTTLIRMGKACGEIDAQTGSFNNLPTAEFQYCQNFMAQVEESTFNKIAQKEVDWTFSDLEEDSIYDMRVGMEGSFLFGDMMITKHPSKDGKETYFTKGIWWMAGKDITVGSWVVDNVEKGTGHAEISDDNLVDISRDLFVGTGLGNKRKIMFCGSDMLTALSKVKSEKFRLKESVEHWNLKFKSWETDFGEILTIHHEMFDENGMSDCAFAMDPEFLTKKTFVNWGRNVIDFNASGQRRTKGVVLQEVSCIYLRYAKAHARMRLVTKDIAAAQAAA